MNTPRENHPLIGTEQTFLPPDKTLSPDANTPPDDSTIVARYGDTVTVREVYENWNGVDGLTMAFVFVPSTGFHTHFSLREMGLTP
jgi:hypothetical protein